MSNDDRTGNPVPGQPGPEQPTVVIPDDGSGQQAVQSEGPRWEGPQHEGVPSGDRTASAAEPVVGPSRRSRWARARGAVRPPSTHRGRVVLTSLAAVALLLVGGGIGLAVGAEVGHDGGRGHSSSQDGDGGRGGDGSSDGRSDR